MQFSPIKPFWTAWKMSLWRKTGDHCPPSSSSFESMLFLLHVCMHCLVSECMPRSLVHKWFLKAKQKPMTINILCICARCDAFCLISQICPLVNNAPVLPRENFDCLSAVCAKVASLEMLFPRNKVAFLAKCVLGHSLELFFFWLRHFGHL